MVTESHSASLRLHLSQAQVSTFLDEAFPTSARANLGEVVSLDLNHLRMRLEPDHSMMRPGDLVSGPTLMGLVDVAAYAVIAAHHGAEAMAVTNSLSIAFLRGCEFKTVFADARLLKLGRRLATVDVRLWQDNEERLIAQSTVGYALP
ncbi:PaaI family thioesterase [Sphingobium sp. WTD-1]|uniref:PaaI family thioesterase n=1 Tax=Sphingobium sp. WTD-1 TaxID=2979467 RepID=UPI0024DEE292|nr:PaaI family thioesterase [Sphingobium sp. WTD-1]WIA54161.1 PaaI family thioesterase [Sphingobium sp. WTD-1]